MTIKNSFILACISLMTSCTAKTIVPPASGNNTAASSKVTLIAGSATEPGNKDDSNPLNARFLRPGKLSWDDRNKTLYVLDAASTSDLRKINQQGVHTVAKAAFGVFNEGFDICLAPDAAGYLYVTTSLGQLLKVNATAAFNSSNPTPIIDWVKADGSRKTDENKTGSLDEAGISGPHGLATVPGSKIYFANSYFLTIHQVNFNNPGNEVTEFAGKPTTGVSAPAFPFANGQGNGATFGAINDMDADNNGNVYAADGGYCVVRKITPTGLVSTFMIPTANTYTYYKDKDGSIQTAQSGTVKHVAVSRDGSIIYFATPGTLRAIIPAKDLVVTIAKFNEGINGIAVTPDGKEVYVASRWGVYKVSDIQF